MNCRGRGEGGGGGGGRSISQPQPAASSVEAKGQGTRAAPQSQALWAGGGAVDAAHSRWKCIRVCQAAPGRWCQPSWQSPARCCLQAATGRHGSEKRQQQTACLHPAETLPQAASRRRHARTCGASSSLGPCRYPPPLPHGSTVGRQDGPFVTILLRAAFPSLWKPTQQQLPPPPEPQQ